jgi:drug/metabolite transporter (DMT)-like permease
MRRRSVAILVAATACWGSAAPASKFALSGGFGPLTLLSLELAIAAGLLWGAVALRRWRYGVPILGPRRIYALLGLFEPGLAYAGLTFGLTYTSAVNGSLLGGLEGLFVVVLAVVLLHERLRRRGLLALAAATVGVVMVGAAHASLGAGKGDLLIVAGVLAAAGYVLLAGRLGVDTDAVSMTAWQFTFGLLFTLPFLVLRWGLGFEATPAHIRPSAWLAAFMVGGAGFTASFLLYNSVVTKVAASVSGIMLNLIPLFGLAAAVVVLGEPATTLQVIGGLLIVVGVSLFPPEDSDSCPAGPNLRPLTST